MAAFEFAPAAVMNFAVAFAVAAALRQNGLAGVAAKASVAAGIVAFVLVWIALRRWGAPRRGLALPAFEPLSFEPWLAAPASEPEELLLTQALAAPSDGEPPSPEELLLTEVHAAPSTSGELLLDDILEILGPDSRVVRLFDPTAVPTAGELRRRIDRHLASDPTRPAFPDASAELHEAIAALKQSLR